jgi:hypothetical protein
LSHLFVSLRENGDGFEEPIKSGKDESMNGSHILLFDSLEAFRDEEHLSEE